MQNVRFCLFGFRVEAEFGFVMRQPGNDILLDDTSSALHHSFTPPLILTPPLPPSSTVMATSVHGVSSSPPFSWLDIRQNQIASNFPSITLVSPALPLFVYLPRPLPSVSHLQHNKLVRFSSPHFDRPTEPTSSTYEARLFLTTTSTPRADQFRSAARKPHDTSESIDQVIRRGGWWCQVCPILSSYPSFLPKALLPC